MKKIDLTKIESEEMDELPFRLYPRDDPNNIKNFVVGKISLPHPDTFMLSVCPLYDDDAYTLVSKWILDHIQDAAFNSCYDPSKLDPETAGITFNEDCLNEYLRFSEPAKTMSELTGHNCGIVLRANQGWGLICCDWTALDGFPHVNDEGHLESGYKLGAVASSVHMNNMFEAIQEIHHRAEAKSFPILFNDTELSDEDIRTAMQGSGTFYTIHGNYGNIRNPEEAYYAFIPDGWRQVFPESFCE